MTKFPRCLFLPGQCPGKLYFSLQLYWICLFSHSFVNTEWTYRPKARYLDTGMPPQQLHHSCLFQHKGGLPEETWLLQGRSKINTIMIPPLLPNLKSILKKDFFFFKSGEMTYRFFLKSGEMAYQLRASAALSKDQGSILSTHVATHNCL